MSDYTHSNQPGWFSQHKKKLIAALLLLLIILVVFIALGYINAWAWVGVVEYEYASGGEPIAVRGKKTLWDLLELFFVPLLLALVLFLLNESREETKRRIADKKQRQESLERYYSQYYTHMENLLLHYDLRGESGEVALTARMRTLDVLHRLDGVWRGRALHFLYDAGLIDRRDSTNPVVSLKEANLRNVDLSYSVMMLVCLSDALLTNANLQFARLNGANMMNVELKGADLYRSDFGVSAYSSAGSYGPTAHTNFIGADLRDAKLKFCDLSGADLEYADLDGADTEGAILEGIVLSKQTNISIEQLKAAHTCEYAFSWNREVHTDIFTRAHQGQLDLSQFPQPFDGHNWSLRYFFQNHIRQNED
jgi:hypothetical protein